MDSKKVIEELNKNYPGKNIIINDANNPTEIICEVEPASLNPERSLTVVVMDEEIKHSHSLGKQTYEVIKGVLELTKGGKTYILSPGESLEIEPGEYHIAKGKEVWVKVISEPGWSSEERQGVEEGTSFE